jgi:hypothetical protein
MKNYLKNTKTLNINLFWDFDPKSIDINKHQRFILERVLNYGTIENLKELFRIYGRKQIISNLFQIKNLSNKSLNFISFYFSIPKSKFKCYTLKQSTDRHWIY